MMLMLADSNNKIDESISNTKFGGLALADLQDRLTNHAEILKKEFEWVDVYVYGAHSISYLHYENFTRYADAKTGLMPV